MPRILVPLTLALVLVFAVAQVASANWGNGGGRGMMGGMMGGGGACNPGTGGSVNLADELELTAEQSARIQELQRQHFEATSQLRTQMQQVGFELRNLRFQRDVDPNQTKALIAQMNELRNQMWQESEKHQTALSEVLTEEQQAKWLTSGGGNGPGSCSTPGSGGCGGGGPRGAGTGPRGTSWSL